MVFVAMETGAEADLAEMLAIGRTHCDGMPMAEIGRQEEGDDGTEDHEHAVAVGFCICFNNNKKLLIL